MVFNALADIHDVETTGLDVVMIGNMGGVFVELSVITRVEEPNTFPLMV